MRTLRTILCFRVLTCAISILFLLQERTPAQVSPKGTPKPPQPSKIDPPLQGWTRQTIPHAEMQLDLPGHLKGVTISTPREFHGLLSSFINYVYAGEGLMVFIGTYRMRYQTPHRKLLSAFVSGIEEARGASDLYHSVQALRQDLSQVGGFYRQDDNDMSIAGFIRTSGERVWVVVTVYPSSHPWAANRAKLVLDSVREIAKP